MTIASRPCFRTPYGVFQHNPPTGRHPALLRRRTGEHPQSLTAGTYAPFQLYEHPGLLQPSIPVAEVLEEGCVVDPVRDVTALIKAARHAQFPAVPGGCGVGGKCFLISVGADGVTEAPLCEFPEQVGDRAAPPNLFAGSKSKARRGALDRLTPLADVGRGGGFLEQLGRHQDRYKWSNFDGSGMNAMFQNGKMIQKSQFGLK